MCWSISRILPPFRLGSSSEQTLSLHFSKMLTFCFGLSGGLGVHAPPLRFAVFDFLVCLLDVSSRVLAYLYFGHIGFFAWWKALFSRSSSRRFLCLKIWRRASLTAELCRLFRCFSAKWASSWSAFNLLSICLLLARLVSLCSKICISSSWVYVFCFFYRRLGRFWSSSEICCFPSCYYGQCLSARKKSEIMPPLVWFYRTRPVDTVVLILALF